MTTGIWIKSWILLLAPKVREGCYAWLNRLMWNGGVLWLLRQIVTCLNLEVFGTCPLDTGVPPCRQCRQCLSRYFVLCINKYKIKLHVCCDKCNVFWCFKRLTKKYKLTKDRIIQHSSNIPECCKITVCKDPALSSYPSLSLLWSRWSFLMMPYIFHATSCLPPFNIAVTRKRELTDMESRNNILSLWDSLNQSFSSAPYEGTGYWSIHC